MEQCVVYFYSSGAQKLTGKKSMQISGCSVRTFFRDMQSLVAHRLSLVIWCAISLPNLLKVDCESVSYADCGSKVGTILDVSISPCPKRTPKQLCTLKRGTMVTAAMKFLPKQEIKAARVSAVSKKWFFSSAIEIAKPDVCGESQGYGIVCPMASGVPVTVSVTKELKSSYATSARVEFRLKNENSDDIVCFEVPVEIT